MWKSEDNYLWKSVLPSTTRVLVIELTAPSLPAKAFTHSGTPANCPGRGWNLQETSGTLKSRPLRRVGPAQDPRPHDFGLNHLVSAQGEREESPSASFSNPFATSETQRQRICISNIHSVSVFASLFLAAPQSHTGRVAPPTHRAVARPSLTHCREGRTNRSCVLISATRRVQ